MIRFRVSRCLAWRPLDAVEEVDAEVADGWLGRRACELRRLSYPGDGGSHLPAVDLAFV
jgi:hypothetical protein